MLLRSPRLRLPPPPQQRQQQQQQQLRLRQQQFLPHPHLLQQQARVTKDRRHGLVLVLEMVRGHAGPLPRRDMNETQQELARRLVFRGVLDRTNIDGKLCYTYNDVEYVER